ncbi:MAG: glycoside hydrolase family 3 C-terminal domain-containing protein [Chloracidobacterium sp.]|nr:glycoside hydrolase family 3 C-terminal domain-containing protein [Chloracidobacterium sp.]
MKSLFSLSLVLSLFAGTLTLGGDLLHWSRAGRDARVPTPRAVFRPSKKAKLAADKLLRRMSVEEKVGQLVHIGINAKFANQTSPFFREIERQVVENKVGGIILFGAPIYESVHLVNRMQQRARVPLLISVDAETGVGMRFEDAINFPWAMAMAATGNPEFARRAGAITGREARALGIHHIFAPVLDVNNNAENPVINVRSFGEDPNDVARFGTAFIDGLQSQKVLATAKHFPGHGDTNVDSHRGLPEVNRSRDELERNELIPFRSAVKAGVASIMVGHIGLPQIDPEQIKPLKQYTVGYTDQGDEIVRENATIPATLSGEVQTDLLRRDIGFDGLIVSDAMDMSGLTVYMSQDEAGVRAVLAGTDMLLKPSDADVMIRGIVAAVRSGRIPQQRLNDAVRRQLAWKFELGLFKQRLTALDAIDTIVSGPEAQQLTDEIATRAITLVRDQANYLPLERGKKVAVLGISNGYEGPAMTSTVAEELRSAGLTVTTGYIQPNSTPAQQESARSAAYDADLVVVGLFGRVRSGVQGSTGLPPDGAALLRGLIESGKPVICVSFGNPYALMSFGGLRTYLVAYGDMPSLQRAAARALVGEQDITGRLPISLPGLYPSGTGIQRRTTVNHGFTSK